MKDECFGRVGIVRLYNTCICTYIYVRVYVRVCFLGQRAFFYGYVVYTCCWCRIRRGRTDPFFKKERRRKKSDKRRNECFCSHPPDHFPRSFNQFPTFSIQSRSQLQIEPVSFEHSMVLNQETNCSRCGSRVSRELFNVFSKSSLNIHISTRFPPFFECGHPTPFN